MSAPTSPQLELLRAKLALAIGPVEVNLAYHEVKAARPDALDEPWSNDVSGPHKYIVFDNKAFVLSEVANDKIASKIVLGIPPIDVGENIKLYLNDVWQLDVFRIFGFDMSAIHYPLPGPNPMGSLYYDLLKAVNGCILKTTLSDNGNEEDGKLGTGDVMMDEKGDEVDGQEGLIHETTVRGNVQEELDGDEKMQGVNDEVEWMSFEEEDQAPVVRQRRVIYPSLIWNS